MYLLNLDKCALHPVVCAESEAKAQDMEAPAQSIAFFFPMETTYTVIIAHKSKSNTSFVTVKGLLLFVCTHNINKTYYKIKKTMRLLVLNRSASQKWTESQRIHASQTR